MWAIIGGTGFEKFDGFETVDNLARETPFSQASSGLCQVNIDGRQCLFLSRHGERHEKLPSEVNYRANIYALKKAGARAVLSLSAVGSLHEQYRPGDMVVPTQFIDRTKGLRAHTFAGNGIVGHTSLADPVCPQMVERLREITSKKSWSCHFKKTSLCIEGPGFSTRAESHLYRSQGADIIGMTSFPEYALAREAGLSYLPCCFVTDYDCWDETRPPVTLQEVANIMKENNGKAFELAKDILAGGSALYEDCSCKSMGLKENIFHPEHLSQEQREFIDILGYSK